MSGRVVVAGAVFFLAAGCYRPQPLDARAVAREARAEASPPRSPSSIEGAGDVSRAEGLTEAEAVALALRTNPTLRALRQDEVAARGEVTIARTLSNPTIDVQSLHLQNLPDRPAWALELRWVPPQPGVYPALGAAARAYEQASRADTGEAELQVTAGVRTAHARLLSLVEQRELLERGIETRRRIRDAVERRVAGGASTRLDLNLAELAVSQMERERDDVAARAMAAAVELGALVGAQGPVWAVGALPEPTGLPPAVDALEELALASRPALRAAESRYEGREQTVRLAHARRWPWFAVMGRYRSNETQDNPNDFMLGIRLALPVFDRNQGGVVVAEATRNREREQMRGLVLGLRRELSAASAEITLRRQTVAHFRDTILPTLDGREQLIATAISGGQMDVVALLAAGDVILRSRREYCDLRLALYAAWVALDRVAGRHVMPAAASEGGAK